MNAGRGRFDHISITIGPRRDLREKRESLKLLGALGLNGGQGVNRTLDTRIFSPLLYRLSYLPTVIANRSGERSFVPMIAAPCNGCFIA
jgi:hypothetical protein